MEIVFYEKPGCVNNTRQKRLLEAAGHRVVARNLLTEPWSAARLRPFLAALPYRAWFNPTSPRIKNGAFDPAAVDVLAALDAMCADPLLIRRPLIVAEGRFAAGFDAPVQRWLGVALRDEDVQTCPNEAQPCREPEMPR
jgi:nitrogenase-associated protein